MGNQNCRVKSAFPPPKVLLVVSCIYIAIYTDNSHQNFINWSLLFNGSVFRGEWNFYMLEWDGLTKRIEGSNHERNQQDRQCPTNLKVIGKRSTAAARRCSAPPRTSRRGWRQTPSGARWQRDHRFPRCRCSPSAPTPAATRRRTKPAGTRRRRRSTPPRHAGTTLAMTLRCFRTRKTSSPAARTGKRSHRQARGGEQHRRRTEGPWWR